MDRTLLVLRIVKVRANEILIWANIGREFSTRKGRGPTLSDWLRRVQHGVGRGDIEELRAGVRARREIQPMGNWQRRCSTEHPLHCNSRDCFGLTRGVRLTRQRPLTKRVAGSRIDATSAHANPAIQKNRFIATTPFQHETGSSQSAACGTFLNFCA